MNDTDPSARIAVIRTRLPYIDRRSLSEAWLSALHLACDDSHTAAVPRRRIEGLPAQRHASAARHAGPAALSAAKPPAARMRATRMEGSGANAGAVARAYAKRSATVRARPRDAGARSYAPFRTSLTVGLEKHRVALVLRRDGATLHVVALCRPEIASAVSRALCRADAHLRARGDRLRSSVQLAAREVRA